MNIKSWSLLLLLTQTVSALARMEIQTIGNYHLADSFSLWKKTGPDEVPAALIERMTVESPGQAYARAFPKSFLQEERFVVCYQDCKKSYPIKISQGETDLLEYKLADSREILEGLNVHHWLRKYFVFLEERFSFAPERFLTVYTDKNVTVNGRRVTNNAYFNAEDSSLNFLPAKNNLFFKLLNGKVNRSGFDPSVIIHEASHYYFEHLFPFYMNQEIGGLNEGFADYIAHIMLDHPKIGLVAFQGQALRDASSFQDREGRNKIYSPKLEVHDLGERLSHALWSTRELAKDRPDFDRIVVDAISELSQNIYATAHDFKDILLARLPHLLGPQEIPKAEQIWEKIIPGASARIPNEEFLHKKSTSDTALSFSFQRTLPAKLAQELEEKPGTGFTVDILNIASLSADVKAMLTKVEGSNYWVVIDTFRKNMMGVYKESSKKKVTTKEGLDDIKNGLSLSLNAGGLISQFISDTNQTLALLGGKGMLNLGYKIERTQASDKTIVFNGKELKAKEYTLFLNRRLLAGALLGADPIEYIKLTAIDSSEANFSKIPTINGLKIIRNETKFGNGVVIKLQFDKLGKEVKL